MRYDGFDQQWIGGGTNFRFPGKAHIGLDKHGLSFYKDATIAVRLRMGEQAVVRARQELVSEDLVAYQLPLTQVLSLPRPKRVRHHGGLLQLGEIFRTLGEDRGHHEARRTP